MSSQKRNEHDIMIAMLPSLSIVIPTKNEEEYLPLLLASIEKQTVKPLEVIIADAGSTDNTVEVAKNFGAKVVEGGLPGPGRNRGAEVAKGEVILFLDADVVLLKQTFIEDAQNDFADQKLDVATADVLPIENKWYDRFSHAFYNTYVRMLKKIHPHAPGFCILVKQELHKRIGGFDEAVLFCEDHDYVYRANKVAKFGILSKGIKIPVSTRRLDKDGRVIIAIKYVLAEMHIWILGSIKHDYFNYQFGYPKKKR